MGGGATPSAWRGTRGGALDGGGGGGAAAVVPPIPSAHARVVGAAGGAPSGRPSAHRGPRRTGSWPGRAGVPGGRRRRWSPPRRGGGGGVRPRRRPARHPPRVGGTLSMRPVWRPCGRHSSSTWTSPNTLWTAPSSRLGDVAWRPHRRGGRVARSDGVAARCGVPALTRPSATAAGRGAAREAPPLASNDTPRVSDVPLCAEAACVTRGRRSRAGWRRRRRWRPRVGLPRLPWRSTSPVWRRRRGPVRPRRRAAPTRVGGRAGSPSLVRGGGAVAAGRRRRPCASADRLWRRPLPIGAGTWTAMPPAGATVY